MIKFCHFCGGERLGEGRYRHDWDNCLVVSWSAQRRAMLLGLSWYAKTARQLAREVGIPESVSGQRLGGILRAFVTAGLVQMDAGTRHEAGCVYWTTSARDMAVEVLGS